MAHQHVKPEPVDQAIPSPAPVPGPSRARSRPPPSRVKQRPPTPELPPPGNYSDYRLVSSGLPADSYAAPEGTPRFNVVKFYGGGEGGADPSAFARPVQMNRRDPRPRPPPPPPADEADGAKPDVSVYEDVKEERLQPVLDAEGKVVKGPDGNPLMAPKQAFDASLIGGGAGASAPAKRKNPFKKKTKQVYKVDADVIRLRREERHPWVLEAADGRENWVGRMDDAAEKQSYVGFVFEDDRDEFEVVDVRRWFKFQRRARYETLGVEEAEVLYSQVGKGKDTKRWLMHDPLRAPSAASSSTASAGAAAAARSSSANPSFATSSSSAARLGGVSLPRIKTEVVPGWLRRTVKVEALRDGVDGSASGGGGGRGVKREEMGDEDELQRAGGRRGSDGAGADGENDQDFEDAFSDDDGLVEFDQTDEQENKELEERMRREQRLGNAQGSDAVSDDDDLFGEDDEATKKLKKTLRKNRRRRREAGGPGDDDSDDDDGQSNPYASSDESSSDEEDLKPTADALAAAIAAAAGGGGAASDAPAFLTLADGTRIAAPPIRARPPTTQPSTATGSRQASPAPPSAGAQVLARRATSPNRPGRSRSASRDRRTASPGPSAPSSRENSPVPGPSSSGVNKRKSTPDLAGDEHKRSRTEGGGAPEPVRKLGGPSERVVIEYIRKASPNIQQLIKHYRKSLKVPGNSEAALANKAALIETIKRIAFIDEEKRVLLKPEFNTPDPVAGA